jgi:hypothetical protein
MKAGTADTEKISITRQWHGEHIFMVINNHATEQLLEAVFLCDPCRGYIRRTNWSF